MMAKLYGVPTISVDEVERKLGQPNVQIIDVNPQRAWAKGHVPKATNLDPAEYTEQDLPADKDAILIFYCSGPLCGAAPHAAKRAKRMGYRQVFVMSEGIEGWMRQHKPVEQST
jgi:rhodanese-related sulfurtransferase